MRVDVYMVCWNEERLLPFFLDHYWFARRIIVYDNESTDDSAVIAAADRRCSIIRYATGETLRDDIHTDIKNNAWKQFSRGQADWVFAVDADEFAWHPRMLDYLGQKRAAGVSRLVATGYDMFLPSEPRAGQALAEQVTRGVRDTYFDKSCAFDPDALIDIGYGPGAHWAEPSGRDVAVQEPEFKLLHMKYVGEREVLWQRLQACRGRLSHVNRAHGWGQQYDCARADFDRGYDTVAATAATIDRSG